MTMWNSGVNTRNDGLPGMEEERSRNAFVSLGGNRWARRTVGADGQPLTYSLEDLIEEMFYEMRAIRIGIERLISNEMDDDPDLLEAAKDEIH